MALQMCLFLFGISLQLKAINSQLLNYPMRKISREDYENGRFVYSCRFHKPMQHCLWFSNSFPIDPKEYGLQYNSETNGINTTDCSISCRYSIFNLTSHSLICVGVREVHVTSANIGDQLQLPCFSDTPAECLWKDSRNREIRKSQLYDFNEHSTDCSLNITYANTHHFGLWTCSVKNNFRILALIYANNGGGPIAAQKSTRSRKKQPLQMGKEDYKICNLHAYGAPNDGLLAGLCVACLAVIVLTVVVIYLYKAQKQKAPTKSQSTTARILPTIKIVNTNSTANELIDDEGLYSVPVLLPDNSPNQMNTSRSDLIDKDNNVEMEMYADVSLSESQLAANDVPHVIVGDVTYAAVIRNNNKHLT